MTKKVKILGKKAIPIWMLVLALVACGAGAAAGTVLAGKVTAEVPIAVSQALLVCDVDWVSAVTDINEDDAPQQLWDHKGMIAIPNRHIGVVSDDRTAFQAAAELAVGDWGAFYVELKNASDNDLYAILTLNVPECLEVEVYADQDINVGGKINVSCTVTWESIAKSGNRFITADSVLTDWYEYTPAP